MTDKLFYDLWTDALASSDRDAYVSDWTLSTAWGDSEDADIPTDRIAQIGRIWDAAHTTVRDLVAASGLSQAAFATRYCIPRRTVEDWCRGLRTPPDYVRLSLARDIKLI